jgi:hypothetical protein
MHSEHTLMEQVVIADAYLLSNFTSDVFHYFFLQDTGDSCCPSNFHIQITLGMGTVMK